MGMSPPCFPPWVGGCAAAAAAVAAVLVAVGVCVRVRAAAANQPSSRRGVNPAARRDRDPWPNQVVSVLHSTLHRSCVVDALSAQKPILDVMIDNSQPGLTKQCMGAVPI